ncbi:hypothetical protein [Microvirga flavescens]|uniref:hypothetical protein n=1 Tax=Microvirga flavescens TaxID=2249811 RepID=UPI0013007E5C|nr:hypothetical protein [Microvirga flavescens]
MLQKIRSLFTKPEGISVGDLRAHRWHTEEPSRSFNPNVPTMLSEYERRMLHWFASRAYTGRGDIADLGCFLGGSTVSLAQGLADNPRGPFGRRIIHSFDMFVCPQDPYTEDLIGDTKRPGDSVLDLYEANVGQHSHLVRTYAGDLLEQKYEGRDLEILFIDVAKTVDLNDFILDNFLSRTLKSGAIVIHQDYNHAWLPWVHWTANALRPYSDFICDQEGSRVQFLRERPPRHVLKQCRSDGMSFEDRCAVLADEIARNENRYSAALVAMGLAWFTFLHKGASAGLDLLNPDQQPLLREPWIPDQVAEMRKWMTTWKDIHGYNRYHETFFSPVGAEGRYLAG